MRISLEQRVFPFLANDPAYQDAVRTERVWRNVVPRLEDELERKISQFVGKTLEGLLESAVKEKYTELVADMGKIHLSLAHIWTVLAEDDPADWWKEGYDDEENEEIVS